MKSDWRSLLMVLMRELVSFSSFLSCLRFVPFFNAFFSLFHLTKNYFMTHSSWWQLSYLVINFRLAGTFIRWLFSLCSYGVCAFNGKAAFIQNIHSFSLGFFLWSSTFQWQATTDTIIMRFQNTSSFQCGKEPTPNLNGFSTIRRHQPSVYDALDKHI